MQWIVQRDTEQPGWAPDLLRPSGSGWREPWALSCVTLAGLHFSSAEGTGWL